ncbi:hypothetical protein HMI55_000634 [Coelomomyces lativittatus]|nr:hypothetical protein HMI55_000634 [Coelomomyces lativittatus]KAJ1509756.1 hypothetical protein HMI56_006648 [Coelomomyces lativittatus]
MNSHPPCSVYELPLPSSLDLPSPRTQLNPQFYNQLMTLFLQTYPSFTVTSAPSVVMSTYYLCTILELPRSCHVSVTSLIPLGAGLGSSASYSVALVSALYPWCHSTSAHMDKDKDKETFVAEYAHLMECMFHGTPSGIDTTMVRMGGMLVYQKDQVSGMAKYERVNGLSPSMPCTLVDTQLPKQTRVMVSQVRELKAKYPEVVSSIMHTMNELTEQAVKSPMTTDHWSYLVHTAQCMLRALNVSTTTLDDMVRTLEQQGGAAKLVGAGGGGCLWVYKGTCPSHWQVYSTQVSEEGVQVVQVDGKVVEYRDVFYEKNKVKKKEALKAWWEQWWSSSKAN